MMILPPTCDRVYGEMENEDFEEEKKDGRMRYSSGFNDAKQMHHLDWATDKPKSLKRDETAEPNKLVNKNCKLNVSLNFREN